MRTAFLRPAVLSLLLAACATQTPGPAVVAPIVALDPDEAQAVRTANARRDSILAMSTWMDFDADACNQGSLRTFAKDTTAAASAETQVTVDALERLIVARGVGNSLDSPLGHELLRTVISWEAALTRPRWDVPAGATTRQAIATGLSGEFKNPETGKCESFSPFDTMYVVIPDVPTFIPTPRGKVQVSVFKGDSGLSQLRDQYYAAHASTPAAVLVYTKLRTVTIWNNYAVVAVNRPAEARGVVQLRQGAGGASYIFHRAGGEWRLLVIARTWG